MNAPRLPLLPLLAPRDLDAPLAWRAGRPLSGRRLLADAQALATRLPEGGVPLNLCADRYRFAVGLAAALLRGQPSLLPPNVLPDTLCQLQATHASLYALVDDDGQDAAGLPKIVVDAGEDDAVPPASHDLETPMPTVSAEQPAACLLTSGSTGAPQPHAKTWGALVVNIAAEAERLAETLGLPGLAGLNVVATVPAQHSYGFESSVLLGLLGGAAFDSGRPFYPADIVAALERLPAPRALVTTPFHLKTLLLSGLPLPLVALVVSATAPLSPQLAAQAEQAFGGQLLEIYGCTEAGQVATRRTTAGEVWHTIGALRLHYETGPQGEERFVVHGGHVLEPTPLADVLELQDERHFRLLGRANDLIHVAGRRSSLAHLNYHLNRVDGVQDGAFWLPDDTADGVVRPIAFVVAPTLSRAALIAALRERLEPAFVPRRVVHVESLPRDGTGKLSVQALRRFALERLHGDSPRRP